MKSSVAIRIVAALLALVLAPSLRAGVLKVPSAQFTTIQSAVDAAVAFDVIKISAGHYDEAVFVQSKTDLTITGSGKVEIEDPGSSTALWLKQCQRVEVKRLRVIENTGFAGILVEGSSDVTVRKCRVLKANVSGIWASGSSNLLVIGNHIENVGGQAIEISFFTVGASLGPATGATLSTFSKNVIKDCDAGIRCNGSANTIEKNRIDGIDGRGVHIAPGGQGCVIAKNRVSDSATAFDCEESGCTFQKNSAVGPDGAGYRTSSHSGNFFKCKVKRPTISGFNVAAAANSNAFEKCSCSKSEEDGFFVAGTSNTLTKCKAKQSVTLDLDDPAGGASTNSYVDCVFGTSNLP